MSCALPAIWLGAAIVVVVVVPAWLSMRLGHACRLKAEGRWEYMATHVQAFRAFWESVMEATMDAI